MHFNVFLGLTLAEADRPLTPYSYLAELLDGRGMGLGGTEPPMIRPRSSCVDRAQTRSRLGAGGCAGIHVIELLPRASVSPQ